METLAKALNEIHGLQKSARFWQIILGHWLRRASKFLIFRISLLRYAEKNFLVKSAIIHGDNFWDQVPTDTLDFTDKLNHDSFILFVDTLIIPQIFQDLELISIEPRHEFLSNPRPVGMSDSRSSKIKKTVQSLVSQILCRKDSPLISSLYTNKINRLRLFFYLKTFPTTSFIYKQMHTNPNIKLRENLKACLAFSKTSSYQEKLILSIIPYILPRLYLEGFAELYQHGVTSNKQTFPRFILTANAFDSDESFKIRTALYTDKHIPYFVLQHGNNYGSNKYTSPTVEELTSDFFLTWGWTLKNKPKYTPLAIQKFTANTFPLPNKSGRILIIMTNRHHPFELWNVYGSFQKIVDSQQLLITNISKDIVKNVDLRLHSASQYLNFGEKNIALQVLNESQIQSTDMSYFQALSQSRLAIFTSDSTGILECLAYNYPCIAIIDNLDYVNSEFICYYEALLKSRILFSDSIKAANHVNDIYANIDRWWFSTKTQQARVMFSQFNARYVDNWPKHAATIINQKISSHTGKPAVL